MHIEHVMTRNPVACEVNDSVEVAAKHMRDKGVGCVCVLENGKLVGLVDDRMLATGVLAEGKGKDTTVGDVMLRNPARLTLEDNIFSAVDTMRSANIARRIPVVNENDELLGIVSIGDIAVIAKDLTDHIMLEETHHALEEARILTGGKALVRNIRRPTKADRLPPEAPIKPVTSPTPEGPAPKSGGAGQTWGAEGEGRQQTGETPQQR